MKSVIIKDKQFWKCVRNTRDDFIDSEEQRYIKSLTRLLKDRCLTVVNIQDLVLIIDARKRNLEYARSLQDTYSFNVVNKEHKIMSAIINKYFLIEDVGGLITISYKGGI
jgi:hypothetical protein